MQSIIERYYISNTLIVHSYFFYLGIKEKRIKIIKKGER